jgi:hypothetical protein
MDLLLFVEDSLSWIRFLVIVSFFEIEKKQPLRYCYTIIPVFGCVTKGYQGDNLNNGLNQEAVS